MLSSTASLRALQYLKPGSFCTPQAADEWRELYPEPVNTSKKRESESLATKPDEKKKKIKSVFSFSLFFSSLYGHMYIYRERTSNNFAVISADLLTHFQALFQMKRHCDSSSSEHQAADFVSAVSNHLSTQQLFSRRTQRSRTCFTRHL